MELQSSVLGRILLLQSGFHAAPDLERLAEMTVQGLTPLPGVQGLAFRFGTGLLAAAPEGFLPEAGQAVSFPMRTPKAHYGALEVRLAGPDDFQPYAPFVANTAHLIALHIENGRFEAELQAANRRLEDYLRQSEERFSMAFRLAPIMMTLLDEATGTFLDVNDAFERGSGFARAELLGRTSPEVGWMEAADRDPLMRQLRLEGHAEDLVIDFRARDGHKVTCLVSSIVIVQGAARQILASLQEITPLVRVQRELRESQARFRDLFADSPVAIQVQDFAEVKAALDDLRRGGVTDWAAHFAQHPGTVLALAERVAIREMNHASAGLVPMGSRDGGPGQLAATFTEHSRATFALELAALAEGRRAWRHEVLRLDGQGLPRWFDLNLVVQPGHEEDLARVLVTFVDIHDRKLAEGELRASEARFRALIDQAPVAVVVSRDGIIQYANSRLLTLFGSDGAMLGKPVADYLAPEAREASLERSQLRTQGLDAPSEVETVGLRAGGVRFPLRFFIARMQVAESTLNISFLYDLTEQRAREAQERALQEQFRQSQKMESLGTLAGGIAHDMNNVLGAIFAVIQTLQARSSGDPSAAELLAVVERAAGRGRDLVRGLVEFARKERTEKVPLDLNDLVRKEVTLLEHTLRQKVQVVTHLEPDLPMIKGSSGALGSALMNLCVNAVDAMPEGGTLGLRTRTAADGTLQVVVEDTGQGMAPEVLARVMEPFYTTKPVGKGTGLGLAMVFNTAVDHGGSLHLSSQVGKGTQVILALPVHAAAAAAPAAGREVAEAAPAMSILLVDDEELIRATVPLMLGVLGHRVEAVEGGRAALAWLAGHPAPDLVILDLNMPDMTGLEVLDLLRRRDPGLPVLIATGYLEGEVERVVAADPHARVLTKPFSFEEIQEKFNLILRRKDASAQPPETAPQPRGGPAPAAADASGPGAACASIAAIGILLLEDNNLDRLFMEGLFKKWRLPYRLSCIETPAELDAALAAGGVDLVLSDFRLQGWDGLAALRRVRAFDPVLPFILLSGEAGDDLIWEAMRAGANDFLVKGSLNRLVPAIERAMAEAQCRKRVEGLQVELRSLSRDPRLAPDGGSGPGAG